jgi:hypothetical protein
VRKRTFLVALFAAAALVAAVAAIGADYRDAGGPEVGPSTVGGHVSNACDGGQKLDGTDGDLVDGTYPFFFYGTGPAPDFVPNYPWPGTITIDVRNTSGGKVFDFYTDAINGHFVTSIYVKGGPAGSSFYNYAGATPAILDVGADDGLHSPYNSNSGKWYGLSHICVFTDKK